MAFFGSKASALSLARNCQHRCVAVLMMGLDKSLPTPSAQPWAVKGLYKIHSSLCWIQFFTKNQLTAKVLSEAISFPVLSYLEEFLSGRYFFLSFLLKARVWLGTDKVLCRAVLNVSTAHLLIQEGAAKNVSNSKVKTPLPVLKLFLLHVPPDL